MASHRSRKEARTQGLVAGSLAHLVMGGEVALCFFSVFPEKLKKKKNKHVYQLRVNKEVGIRRVKKKIRRDELFSLEYESSLQKK